MGYFYLSAHHKSLAQAENLNQKALHLDLLLVREQLVGKFWLCPMIHAILNIIIIEIIAEIYKVLNGSVIVVVSPTIRSAFIAS